MKRRKGRELQMLWKWKAQEVERRMILYGRWLWREKVVSRFEIAANWDYERKETFWT